MYKQHFNVVACQTILTFYVRFIKQCIMFYHQTIVCFVCKIYICTVIS